MSKKPDKQEPTKELVPSEDVLTEVLAPEDFEAEEDLTVDVMSITRLGPVAIRVLSGFQEIPMDDPANPGTKRPVPALKVGDLFKGKKYLLICNAVMASTFRQEGDALVGAYYALIPGEMQNGKRYRKVKIVRLRRKP